MTQEFLASEVPRMLWWIALIAISPVVAEAQDSVSGIYSHLAFFNDENESGTGAVVPWEGRSGSSPTLLTAPEDLRTSSTRSRWTCSKSSERNRSAERRRTAWCIGSPTSSTSQGRKIFANNCEPGAEALRNPFITAGVLAEWDGADWRTAMRARFAEVTGPGGSYGNEQPETDCIWCVGRDARSLILMLLDHGQWQPYRLPKGPATVMTARTAGTRNGPASARSVSSTC